MLASSCAAGTRASVTAPFSGPKTIATGFDALVACVAPAPSPVFLSTAEGGCATRLPLPFASTVASAERESVLAGERMFLSVIVLLPSRRRTGDLLVAPITQSMT